MSSVLSVALRSLIDCFFVNLDDRERDGGANPKGRLEVLDFILLMDGCGGFSSLLLSSTLLADVMSLESAAPLSFDDVVDCFGRCCCCCKEPGIRSCIIFLTVCG